VRGVVEMAGPRENALVIGPGPVTLAQGPAFQYIAARACRRLRSLGLRVLVLEDNPATLMDVGAGEGDLFLEPAAAEVVEGIVSYAAIGSIWYGFGGRRGWVLAMRLAREGWYEESGMETPGLDDRAIWLCGDRSLLREALEAEGIRNPAFHTAGSMREGQDAAERLGFPLVVRPNFSCGGWGAGLAYNLEDYPELLEEAMRESLTGEVLVEEALDGWRKYIAMVLRDGSGRSCVAGVLEQQEPLPLHDGDSVLAYPAQLAGKEGEYAVSEMARKVADILDLSGLAEIKLAAAPGWEALYVVDVNPQPWRNMPLVETATGTDLLQAHMDLVMGKSLEKGVFELEHASPHEVTLVLPDPTPRKEGEGEGYLALGCRSMGHMVLRGNDVAEAASRGLDQLRRAGYDGYGAETTRALERLVRQGSKVPRKAGGLQGVHAGESPPSYRMPCSGGGDASGGVMLLASDNGGPGGGYEANFNCYHAFKSWKDAGEKAAIYTPDLGFALLACEEADAVFLGPLEEQAARKAVSDARTDRLVAHFGGRAAMDLAAKLVSMDVEIQGLESIEGGERLKSALEKTRSAGLHVVGFKHNSGREEAEEILGKAEYPLLATVEEAGARSSQRLIYTPEDGAAFLREHPGPVLWRPLREESQEVLVEAVGTQGEHIVLLWEQVDAAGIFSTDGLGVYPPCYLTSEQSGKALTLARRTIDALGWRGNLSMRIHISNGDICLWSVSPGPSANLPFLYRASSMPLAAWGMMALHGREPATLKERETYNAVRAPLIPYGVIADSDILPTPQRRSTGAVIGLAKDPGMALAKALWSQGMRYKPGGKAFLSVANREKRRALMLARELIQAGFLIMATRGTAHALEAAGIGVETVNKLREGRPNILDLVRNGQVGLVINVPRGKHPHSDGFYIRAASARHGIPCITNMEVALALARGLRQADPPAWEVRPLEEYGRSRHEVRGG
jgi:carbamoylphosphate synthase large subunit